MTGVLALREAGREVTVCCGGHRPASGCLCLAECVTNSDVSRLDPAVRAVVAHDDRERRAALRMTARRAEQLLVAAAIDENLADWWAALRSAIVPVLSLPEEPAGLNRWFTRAAVA